MKRFSAVTVCAALTSSATAAPLNPWAGATSAGTVLPTQYVYAGRGGASTSTYLGIGFTDHIDVITGAGVAFEQEELAFGGAEVIPRFCVTEGACFAARVASDLDRLEVGPELHTAWSKGIFAFTGNFAWRTVYEDSSVGMAIIAPEVFVSERLSLFTEINPSIDFLSSQASVSLVPGASLTFGKDSNHSVAVGLDVAEGAPPMFGAWYGTGFSRR